MTGEAALAACLAPFAGAAASLPLRGRARDLLAVAALAVAALASTAALMGAPSEAPAEFGWAWVESLGVGFRVYVDSLSAVMGAVVAWLSFLIGVYSLEYMAGDPGLRRYWFFFDFFVGSMLTLVYAENLLVMFLGWEGTGLASYALIGHWYTDEEERCVGDVGRTALGVPMWFEPSHSGLRAIAFTRLGDVGFILGIGVLYALTGTFSIPEIAEAAPEWGGVLASRGLLLPFLVAFSLGAMAKSAQFPFHEWLVTAMTGPTSVSALIHAATMVKAGVYFLLRFVPIFALAASAPGAEAQVHAYFAFVATLGAFTAFFMATQAVVARELKLILAFSTASQLGYMFSALGAAGLLEEASAGLLAGMSHLMSHAMFKACLFLSAGAMIHAVHTKYVDEMGALSRWMKLTFASALLGALSLSGVPPLMGFWTKDSVVEALAEAGLPAAFLLGVITAALTAFYSIRMVLLAFAGEPSERVREHPPHEAHPVMLAPYLLLALASLGLGLAWPLLYGPFSEFFTSKMLACEAHAHAELHLDPALTAASLAMVGLGAGLALLTYSTGAGARVRAAASGPLGPLQSFLYDRWLINSAYYRAIVGGFAALSRGLFRWFDTAVIDGLYHRGIPALFWGASGAGFRSFERAVVDRLYHSALVSALRSVGSAVRRVQTGYVVHYILLVFLAVGLALLMWVV